MAFQLDFAQLVYYDAGLPGITVEASLRTTDVTINFTAKIDTGSSRCVFARNLSEQLGLDVEDGDKSLISTATGTFAVYQHEVSLNILDFDLNVFAYFAADENFNRNVL